MLPIVVGIHLHAEAHDRPLAYKLHHHLIAWQEVICDEIALEPVIMTDIWYLNHAAIHQQPVITIGNPKHNALTAFLTDKVPTVHAIDRSHLIQMDPAGLILKVCLWGEEAADTLTSVEGFCDRFMDDYLQNAIEWVAH